MLKKLRLTGKLMASIGVVAMISFIVTVSFITINATKLAKKNAIMLIEAQSREYSNEIRLAIEDAFAASRTLAYSVKRMKEQNNLIKRETLISMIEGILKENKNFLGIWLVLEPNAFDGLDSKYKNKPGHDEAGRFIPYSNRTQGSIGLDLCTDLSGSWYTKPRDSKKEAITDPQVFNVAGRNITMMGVAVPIVINGISIGVAGVDFSMDQIADLFEKIKPYETGYAVFVTPTGMIAAHPQKNKTGKNLDEVYPAEVNEMVEHKKTEHVNSRLETDGADSIMISTPIEMGYTGETADILINAPLDKMLAGVYKMRNISIIISIFFLTLLLSLIFLLSRLVIIKPVKNVIDSLVDISEGDGDLTKRLEINTEDELGKLAQVFNSFMEKLQIMIKDIKAGVEKLSSSSSELSSISEEMSLGATKTSEKSTDVATSTEEMTSNLTSISAAMEQSSTNTDTVATAAEEMNSTINEIAQNAEQAREISEKAVHKVNDSTDKMNELGTAASAIGKVVETITDISEQVNLLSLNATIEAARAGDAGKGFAVVANEIKDLANQTSAASGDIKNKIEDIQNSSDTTVKGISEISEVINSVNEIVSTIATAVEEQSAATQEIASNIGQASVGIQEVNQNVGESSAVAEDISRDITMVNQASVEMANRSLSVKTSSDDLSSLAEQLNTMVGRFKV